MDVSIIIINYHTTQLILNCLSSIYQHTTGVSFEIIIVDNDPPQGGGTTIRSQFPEVHWVDMSYNAGFGRANNEGMKRAKGRYFLLLNADTLLVDNVIKRCVERMDRQTEVVACSLRQIDAQGNEAPLWGSFNELRQTLFILPPGPAVQKLMDKLYPISDYKRNGNREWLSGAFLLLRREAFERTGGFDEDFFMYGEDVEWSGRLGKLGTLRYFEDLSFIHLENNNPFRRTNISWINRFNTQMQVSNFLWIRKQYGLPAYLGLIFSYIFMIPTIFVWKMLINLKKHGNPLAELRTQVIFTRKTGVILKYFPKMVLDQRYFYKIKPSENIDLLTVQ
ncbi:glycosyltransferase family 2 protein [Telluribacter sp.]|jgi:hypothetical protein|uniref:glycosyltransferase family 2 protein n=1 Tax=Telluribacter sp. TaxID=1978767 RepID=UPI002E13CE7C|nr:glycosyltransferase family 2 protein [Telluribacter sp.]